MDPGSSLLSKSRKNKHNYYLTGLKTNTRYTN
jgi:hypothetical protein